MYKKKIGLAIILIIAGFGLYFTYTFYRVFFLPNTAFENETSYVFIPTGSDLENLLEELAPLLLSSYDFRLAAEKKGYASRIKAGKYALEKGMSNNDMINRLRGKSLPVKVTFNNQERLEDLAGRLAQQLEADSLVFSTEKSLKEHGDKVSAEEKQAIENGITDLKKSLEGTDVEDIKKKTQSLIQASMKLGEAVYKSQQKPDAKTQGKDDNKTNDKDNVVDADFEDVKEKKEEDKEKSA